jgi:proton-coupled amino acid transporter
MREPRKFPKVLTGVMITLLCEHLFNVLLSFGPHCAFLVLFGGAGALSYLTFGSSVNTVVLVNLDQTSKFTQSVSLSQ